MNSQRIQKTVAHLKALIVEGLELPQLERESDTFGSYFPSKDRVRIQSWLVRVGNVLETVFGSGSMHCYHFKDYTKDGFKHIETGHDVFNIVGILDAALHDIEGGYLLGQEFLLAAEVHDSLLCQAKDLCSNGYVQASAVLARVVLEETLRRVSAAEGLDAGGKASALNEELKRMKVYSQPQWRLIQVCLDVGNSAAHGKIEDLGQATVERMIEDVERFSAAQLAGR